MQVPVGAGVRTRIFGVTNVILGRAGCDLKSQVKWVNHDMENKKLSLVDLWSEAKFYSKVRNDFF